jgi:hypothetical protein
MTIADRNELRQPAYGNARGLSLADRRTPRPPVALGRARVSRPENPSRLAGFALAIAATIAWVLAALGRLEAGAIIGWWFGWSVFEVFVRLDAKPYVKEGPWWGHLYRRATVMDMICYVSFKNLLIGAVLFIGLKMAGLLQV